MKKLFTFAAAVLASASMFAADYTPAVTNVYTVGDATTLGANWVNKKQNANYFEVVDTVVFSPFVNYSSNADKYQNWTGSYGGSSTGATWEAKDCFRGSTAWFSSDSKAATVRTTRYYLYNVTNCTEVKALLKSNGSIKMTLAAYEIADGVVSETAAQSTDFTESSIGVATIKNLNAAKTYQVKVISDNSGTNTVFYEIAFVHPHPCTDPEFTVSPTEGTGFVGDAINIAVTSKNQSKPINPVVTVDGEEAVYGTDYTFSASTGLVQATPLRAGTFVITFSQASDGTYCDAEESATFVISAKSPVTSFEIEGPTSARVGDKITLTATNFNAAATEIVWRDELNQDLEFGATHTFTPDAEDTYQFFVSASNEFNDKAVVVNHNVSVTIGHNAYLSDLKVNGTTIEGFDDEKFEYDLGEIGVYEIPNVVATPADAPYATAVVNVAASGVLVSVIAQDKTTIKEYIIHFTRAAATPLASISGNTTWDFTKTGTKEIKLTDSSLPKKTDEFVFADLLTNPDASFKADALAGIQEYVVRDGKFCQGLQLRFVTTVNGSLEVIYCNTGNRETEDDRRFLVVNGNKVGNGSMQSNVNDTISNIAVSAGEVILTGVLKKDESAQYLRFHKVVFTEGWPTDIDNAEERQKATKKIEDGQLVIIKNGVKYNAQGAIVK